MHERSVRGNRRERPFLLLCDQLGPRIKNTRATEGTESSDQKTSYPRTFAIIGAAYDVHRILGTGFLEIFYKDALAIEFIERQIPFWREAPCVVEYKGRPLRQEYHVDFICFDEIVLEIKARSVTGPADHAQVISYLASTKKRCGLLLNFGAARLEHRRFIWEPRN